MNTDFEVETDFMRASRPCSDNLTLPAAVLSLQGRRARADR